MAAKIIDGNAIAAEIRGYIKTRAADLAQTRGIKPGLVTILVGSNPASISYVSSKNRIAKELGFHSIQKSLPAETTEQELLEWITAYNKDKAIHGILVQLPLPKHMDTGKIILSISPEKDVDCFHPVNLGKLVLGEGIFRPCTPAGIIELIKRSGYETAGAEVVIVGRSNIVGKPLAVMLMQKTAHANATVTVCHTATKDIASHTRIADILIVAAGFPNAVNGSMIKPGACVIDVGVNRIGITADGKAMLRGDVDFDSAVKVAGAITPVPGGVGPMTITMLMENTLTAASLSTGLNF